MRMVVLAVAATMIAGAGSAVAQERTGYQAIAAGDLATAEATIARERAIFPQRPELMLNLAAIYARTGRVAEARALYADVLQRDGVDLELGDGSAVSSHLIAKRGLARLDTAFAAR
jgi:Flp pilus assembly protein TadD